jgi:hypothetical protein
MNGMLRLGSGRVTFADDEGFFIRRIDPELVERLESQGHQDATRTTFWPAELNAWWNNAHPRRCGEGDHEIEIVLSDGTRMYIGNSFRDRLAILEWAGFLHNNFVGFVNAEEKARAKALKPPK